MFPLYLKLNVWYLSTLPIAKLIQRRWQINWYESGVLVEKHWHRKHEVLWEKRIPEPLYPPQIPRGRKWGWTRLSEMRGRLKRKNKVPHKKNDNFNPYVTDSFHLLRHSTAHTKQFCFFHTWISNVKCCVTGSFIEYRRLGFNTTQR